MSVLLRALVAVLLLAQPLAALAQAPQQPAPFSTPFSAKDAEAIETRIRTEARDARAPKKEPAGSHRQTGQRQLAEKNYRDAARAFMLALNADGKDAASWAGLARALLAIVPDENRGSERYEFPVQAAGAAWRAYERATAGADKAAALELLSDAMQRRSLWRPAMDALKASLALSPSSTAAQSLEKLVADHGFRILDYKIDADAVEPRLCINFSERLNGTPADLAKYVSVDGQEPQNLTADGRQLCIDGMQHGRRYEVQVRSGVPAETGEQLPRVAEMSINVRDRAPSVRFSGRAYVLPNRGQQGIPVVTTNTSKVAAEIYRIGDRALATAAQGDSFLKHLGSWDIDQVREKQGQRIWKGELAVAERRNEDVTTALPVGEAVPKLEPGVYILSASIPAKKRSDDDDGDGDSNGRGGARATQWFIVSDLGLTALTGADGLHAFVRSLATATPVAGIQVRLVAKNNEVLGTAKTDAAGYARFPAALKNGEGGMAPSLLVAEATADYAFLDLASAAFDLTDRGVKGREAPGPIDAYLFPERGVYRPGEPVHLTGLVRDAKGHAATLPTTLIIQRPDGVEHARILMGDEGLGGRTRVLQLAATAMTGTWRAKLHTDPKAEPIAQTAFLVEDFVPERLDMKLTPQAKSIAVEETVGIDVDGKFLYGPPAAGMALEGEIVVRVASGDLAGLPGYRFGLADERVIPVRKPIEDLGATSEAGKATIPVRLPPITKTARPLEANVIVRLRETGGRSIERAVTLPVAVAEPRVGVKPLFADLTVGEGDAAAFDVQVIGPDGKPVAARDIKWTLSRLEQRWQWYSRDGQWNYETTSTARRVATGTAEAQEGKPARIESPVTWGRWRLEVTAAGATTSVLFSSGWQASENLESPENLDIALDKPNYKAGETARLRITSKEAGKAQIAVLSSGVLASQQVDVPAGGTEVTLTVDETWMPGAYVTATLYRAMDETARRMPGRAVGVKWLALDTASATLKVGLSAPARAKPSQKLTVPVKIAGLIPGEEARVTVAAVDVGILNLTRFESPAPEKWFLAQRRLGLEVRDFYGRLIDGMRAERGRLRSGGDGGGMSVKGSPPVEAPLSLFSGIVKVGPDGTAEVGFDIPDFNGSVRLMAVAWSGSKTGSGQQDVIVRDQLTLTATAPRFLSLGDEARLDLEMHNVEGPDGTYAVRVEEEREDGSKRSVLGRDIALKPGTRGREIAGVKPTGLGRVVYDVRVEGPGGIAVKRRVALEVKPPHGDIRRSSVSALAPSGGRIEVTKDILTDLIPASSRLSLSVGPTAALDVPSLMAELDRYPYGCAEQTTSRALPLLYVSGLAKKLGLAEEGQLKGRIQKAIERVFEMQEASGAFGVWGPSNGDLWLTAYVTDFLTRAKEAGFIVRQQPFGQALDRLANFVGYAQDFEKGGEARAYALYVLARNSRAPAGDLRYDVDTRLEKFASPLAKAQLGAALAMLGEKERAERAFASALKDLGTPGELNLSRSDYGSFVRDGAGLLTLAAETNVSKAQAPRLASVLAEAYRGRTYTSTQEKAWMLLAAHALSEQAASTRLSVNGETMQGELTRALSGRDLERQALSIVNQGDAGIDAVVSVVGSSLTAEPAIQKGFSIERRYYTLDGKPVDMKSAEGGTSTLAQNQRLVVVLKIEGTDQGGRILVVDRLPAGLEIENPRLVSGGELKGLDFIEKSGREPEHTEFRDDRFVAAFNFFGEGRRSKAQPVAATMAYIVRAVTPGSYTHPAATVEDMYRPDQFARTAAGKLTVTAGK